MTVSVRCGTPGPLRELKERIIDRCSTWAVNKHNLWAKYFTSWRHYGWRLITFFKTHPNLVFLWYKGRFFRAITGDCKLAASTNFISGISASGNWNPLDSFSFPLVSFSCRCHARRIRRTRIHNQLLFWNISPLKWFEITLIARPYIDRFYCHATKK